VDFSEVPRGPWSTLGENNTFVINDRKKGATLVEHWERYSHTRRFFVGNFPYGYRLDRPIHAIFRSEAIESGEWKIAAPSASFVQQSSSQLTSASLFLSARRRERRAPHRQSRNGRLEKRCARSTTQNTVSDLPPPSSNILSINRARVVNRPADAQLRVLPGFKIELYAEAFRDPRFLSLRPMATSLLWRSRANQIKVLRDTNGDGKPDVTETFVERDLNKPFGIAFYSAR